MADSKTKPILVWIDPKFGIKGYLAWLFVFGALGFAYGSTVSIQMLLLREDLPTLVLSGFVFLSQSVLFLSAAIFVYSGYRTAQQAEVNSESCMIKFYYGRKRIFKLSQVEDINTFNLKIKFPLYFTPLNQLGLNYRINLMGGKVIYVSGLMPNVDELIRQIKTQRSGHPKVG